MKCPNCEGVMPGSVAVCKTCGHRLTQASIEKWRAERGSSNNSMPVVSESALAAKVRARFSEKQSAKPETNLIQFPVPANVASHAPALAEPAWRNRIKSSVQDRRARQTSDEPEFAATVTRPSVSNSNAAAEPDQLLLVESALKRIRRTPAPPPATVAFRAAQKTPINYPSAQSHALALMPEAERYAEAQRVTDEFVALNDFVEAETQRPAPVAAPQPMSRPQPSRPAANVAIVKTTHHRKLTGAHLAMPLDEEPSLETPEFALEALSLTAETLPALREAPSATETAVNLLRAKAEFFAQTQPASETEEDNTPWHTDAEAAAIQTNPQIWLGNPAPLWLRTLAGICDIEAAAILYLPFFSAYYALEGTFDGSDYYVMALMAVIVMFLYQFVTFSLNGRTIGMALFGLRNFDVERAHSRISFTRRLQQAFGGTVGLLCPPFNFVVTRVTGFQRGFGDALAKTVTLRRAQE